MKLDESFNVLLRSGLHMDCGQLAQQPTRVDVDGEFTRLFDSARNTCSWWVRPNMGRQTECDHDDEFDRTND